MSVSGCMIGMRGKKCVAIASDNRVTSGPLTVPLYSKKIFRMAPRLYLGVTGVATDVLTVHCQMIYRKNVFEIREKREITSQAFRDLMSTMLYEHRFAPFYVESVIVGLDSVSMEPRLCSMNFLGGFNEVDDFVVLGSATPQLYGICAALWRSELEPDMLFEVAGQSMLRAVEGDVLSGWGARVVVIEGDKMTERTIKTSTG